MKPRVLLIDFDSKIPNLALMQLSSYYKANDWEVVLTTQTDGKKMPAGDFSRIFCSVVFTRNKSAAQKLKNWNPDIEFGGSGWDLVTELPLEVQLCKPDYELYTAETLVNRIKGIGSRETKLAKAQMLVDAGIGFTSRGCVRKCSFCIVPIKEGKFEQASEIKDLINPRSNKIILLDNNLTSDPLVLEKLREIRERNLVVNITQGVDVRLMTEEKALALSQVKRPRKLCYAWDSISSEKSVLAGIQTLTRHINHSRQMCFFLCGFDSTFEEDVYRFRKLVENGIDPFCMVYNQKADIRLKHFARWVNSRIYKTCSFEEYTPWRNAQRNMGMFVNELYNDTFSLSISQLQLIS